MLSYQHGYHAGNHADVFKHATIARIVARLLEKDKPFTYIDTHAGSGIYPVNGEKALKTGEMSEGFEKLLGAANYPPILAPWYRLASSMVRERGMYPGSPEVVRALSRPEDALVLMELHPTEAETLAGEMAGDPRVHVHRRDGYAGLVALTPPSPRRGFCLVDPSYELETEYVKVAETVIAAHRRWPVGIIALWYPIVGRRATNLSNMIDRLGSAGIAGTLIAELHARKAAIDETDGGYGMTGSGMIVLQAPWRLEEDLEIMLPWLIEHLAMKQEGFSRLEWLVPRA